MISHSEQALCSYSLIDGTQYKSEDKYAKSKILKKLNLSPSPVAATLSVPFWLILAFHES
jgi:hypothetical protein